MAEMRLIDSNDAICSYVETWTCNCSDYGTQKVMAVDDISTLPEINPETLPIVKELRAEIERLNKGIENLSKNVENAYKQRDRAVEQLRGICRSCKNYTENHCCGPCADCKYEYYAYRFADAKDRWEWIG